MNRTLVIASPGSAPKALSLEPGTYPVGRDEGNSILIDHPSIAGRHCELTVYPEGGILVRSLSMGPDAGHGQGTWIDDQQVGVEMLGPGQKLRLGEVECWSGDVGGPDVDEDVPCLEADERVSPGGGTSVAPEPPTAAEPEGGGTAFWGALPGALTYPFRGDAWIPLLVIVALEHAHLLLPAPLRIAGLGLGILIGAYLLQLGRAILLTTHESPEAPLPNPEVSFDPDDLRAAFGTYFALVLVCFGPAIAAQWIPTIPAWVRPVALGLGCAYFPMALLGVAVGDRLGALSPTFVVPSILRVPVAYGATVLALGLILGLEISTGRLGADGHWPRGWALAWSVTFTAVSFYLLVVWLRVLGLFYHHHREQLAWEF